MAIKVLVIDDSSLMRSLLSRVVIRAPDIEVVGTAPDPIEAREMIRTLKPDVLTLDVEMPKMDGLEFLSMLMRIKPMPVVMISSLTERGSAATLKALELGAFEVVSKPGEATPGHMADYADEICDKIRAAYEARNKILHRTGDSNAALRASLMPQEPRGVGKLLQERHLVAIGASTGGTEAIRAVLQPLPADMPGIVMVQHMPELFTASFAKRLDGLTRLKVVEAKNGDRVQPGHVYLAPGSHHLRVNKAAGGFSLTLSSEAPFNRHRPSVDVLFDSVATAAGKNATGIILTGMGKDGAVGLLRMHQAGAWTIGQDEDSCIVYGMPREAAALGAVEEVVPLKMVADRLLDRLGNLDTQTTTAA